jgi:hypothetical protein
VTITRVGTSRKYAAGWDRCFGRKPKTAAVAAKPATSPAKGKAAPSTKQRAATKKPRSRKTT